MKKGAFLLAIAIFAYSVPVLACDLTGPTVKSWTCDDYYGSGHQWSCFLVTLLSNSPIIETTDPAVLQQKLWYFDQRADGTIVEISLNPPSPPQTAPIDVSYTATNPNGCYQVVYTIQGVKDFPNIPSACEKNPVAPAACKARLVTTTAEAVGWNFTDEAGVSSGNVVGNPCVTQGSPGTNNAGNRGASCSK